MNVCSSCLADYTSHLHQSHCADGPQNACGPGCPYQTGGRAVSQREAHEVDVALARATGMFSAAAIARAKAVALRARGQLTEAMVVDDLATVIAIRAGVIERDALGTTGRP